MEGITGENLLVILERRLDNVIYRSGFATSRAQARQLITHGHFTVNDRKLNIPSFLVKVGDVVEIREKSKNMVKILESLESAEGRGVPSWILLDKSAFKSSISKLPERKDIPLDIKEHLIIELYSK
jgi:small subunit ribosomal protein S4